MLALAPNFIASRPYPMANDLAGVVVASADSKLAVGDEVFGTVWVRKCVCKSAAIRSHHLYP